MLVKEMMMLLNVALMCASPVASTFTVRLRVVVFAVLAAVGCFAILFIL
jgi:hypothetical protein